MLPVPGDALELGVVGDGDLLAEVDEHCTALLSVHVCLALDPALDRVAECQVGLDNLPASPLPPLQALSPAGPWETLPGHHGTPAKTPFPYFLGIR